MKIVKLRNKNNEEVIPESISKLRNYSYNETIIGTWFSKPLYRKVINATTPALEATWTSIASIDSNAIIRIINGTLANWLVIPAYVLPTHYISFQVVNGDVQVYVMGYTNVQIELIVEYTKTTD